MQPKLTAMDKNVVGWFEIPVTDMERAKKFYSQVFGFEMAPAQMPDVEMSFFPWVDQAPHASGALVRIDDRQPSAHGALVYFNYSAWDEIDKVEQAGGEVLQRRTSIGEHGFYGLIKDTEGNVVGLHSNE